MGTRALLGIEIQTLLDVKFEQVCLRYDVSVVSLVTRLPKES